MNWCFASLLGERVCRVLSRRLPRWRIVTAVAAAAAVHFAGGCKQRTSDAPREKGGGRTIRFVDVSEAAGIRHVHRMPRLDAKLDNINAWVSSVGAAAAAGDFDRDGWVDLYVTNSRKGTPNYLYHNNGDGTFADVAASAGVADVNGSDGVSMDCVWGDYDNDGWIDLYLVRWGRDALFRSNGDGTLTDVTGTVFRRRNGEPGIDWANGNAAVFLDFNLDGRLDIYVGNYFDEVDLWNLESTRIMHDSFENARNAGRNFLYQQKPDGTFQSIGESLGLDDRGWTLAVGSADVNNDGWPDVYCADDFGPDQLFLNNGDGTFENTSEVTIGHDTKKGMNVDFGDFDNDGWLDIYVTNITTAEYLQEGNMLWHNNGVSADGELLMTDISLDAGVYDGGWGWGAKFFDYDLDGDLDLIALNGFISAGEGNYWYDLASWTVTGDDPTDANNWPPIGNRSFSGYENTRLWRNDGWSAFTEHAQELGLASNRDGRGVVVFDYDNDGDPDVYVANHNQPPHLYRNDGANSMHWLQIRLEGNPTTRTSRDAVGTRVTIVTSAGRQIRERDGGNGFSGQSDARLLFGLGDAEQADLVEVRWPDQGTQYLEDVTANQCLTIRQDPAAYDGHATLVVARPAARRRQSNARRDAPKVKPVELDRWLDDLEDAFRSGLAGYSIASRYRSLCADNDLFDRAIRFFADRIEANPDDTRSRIELGSAFVDKIPTCGGLAAIVCKGSLAKKSLDQFDAVIAKEPQSWVAYYCRGMNHLHWPRSLRHSAAAARDFARCVALAQSQGGPLPSYLLRVYTAWGDALVKDKRYDEGRAVWREGLTHYADAKDLRERLAIETDDELLSFVLSRRNLQQPVDTGLAFLDP